MTCKSVSENSKNYSVPLEFFINSEDVSLKVAAVVFSEEGVFKGVVETESSASLTEIVEILEERADLFEDSQEFEISQEENTGSELELQQSLNSEMFNF